MATRKRDVEFASTKNEREFRVWCDLSAEEIEGIEGVVCTVPVIGAHVVICDPRYDMEEIKQEICALSESS